MMSHKLHSLPGCLPTAPLPSDGISRIGAFTNHPLQPRPYPIGYGKYNIALSWGQSLCDLRNQCDGLFRPQHDALAEAAPYEIFQIAIFEFSRKARNFHGA